MRRFTDEEKDQIWDWHQAGVPVKRIARRLGRNNASLRKLVGETGGVRPRARVVNERHLSLAEREEISRGLAAGLSLRVIAERLGRAPSRICREVNAHGGRGRDRALVAERAARRRARGPKVAKLAQNHRLRAKVEAKLKAKWSPEEILAGWQGPIRRTPRCRCRMRPSISRSSSRAEAPCATSCTSACEVVAPGGATRSGSSPATAWARSATW